MEWFSWSAIIGIVVVFFTYLVATWVYHAYFDGLSTYPGPKFFAASWLPFTYYQVNGTAVYKIADLHAKYGPVVRVSPTSLSYITADAWNDIHSKTRPQMAKDPEIGPKPPNGVKGLAFAERDDDHTRMRRNLAFGFTEHALRDQEALLGRYVDLLITKVREASRKGPINVVDYFNFVTVDLVGELTFGRSFDCLTSSTLHPWMENIFSFLKAFVIIGMLSKFKPLGQFILWLGKRAPGFAEKERLHRGFINDRLDARLARKETHIDFMTHVQKHTNTPHGMSIYELQETCNALMLGGSETSASAMSSTVYSLLSNPSTLKKLQHEVRSAFKKEEDITFASTNNLKYLHASLTEGMRLFPPLPAQIARMTGPNGDTICSKYVPPNTNVGVSHYAAYRSPSNFALPDSYRPDRWLAANDDDDDAPDEFANDNKKVYQPFSMGPRNCIGKNLAWAEMRMIMAKMVWHFDWVLKEESRDWPVGMRSWGVFDKAPLMVQMTEVER